MNSILTYADTHPDLTIWATAVIGIAIGGYAAARMVAAERNARREAVAAAIDDAGWDRLLAAVHQARDDIDAEANAELDRRAVGYCDWLERQYEWADQ